MVMRPHTVRRDTLENIQENKHYTINHVGADFSKQAHQTSASYEQNQSEFAEAGLTPEYLDGFAAPYVQQSPIRLGLTLIEIIPIKHNDTLFVIGEVQHAYVPDTIISEDGFVALDKAGIICINGLDGYSKPSSTKRYTYAKPDKAPEELPL
jgi:flavin reductase (DIM6/NTAB) family NADH-FMN oxidoreductase RutF